MIIGISGGSGSGKTTLLRRLVNYYARHESAVLCQDNYYLPKDEQLVDSSGWINFDLPTAIDQASFHSDLVRLIEGKSVCRKEYGYNVAGRQRKELITEPSRLIFVEGLYVFFQKEVRDLLEVRILMKTEQNLQYQRRLLRDQKERDLKKQEVEYQWKNHVLPCYENYLLPLEKHADFCFENNVDFEREFVRLVHYIDQRIK